LPAAMSKLDGFISRLKDSGHMIVQEFLIVQEFPAFCVPIIAAR
jgi:hypothetical protein